SGGGSGTYPFTVAGVAVLTTALFLMIRGKRKERV
ncbi:MAG: LPXTG cell wall anchor domain-containing protein, partial [Oscillospiraceae bacterium]|nr:LPXTG cell wall anchor domain-containing protein [Oscillospiraceae bacterium]